MHEQLICICACVYIYEVMSTLLFSQREIFTVIFYATVFWINKKSFPDTL
jgi:hypothetical protein